MRIAMFSTKPYDREFFEAANEAHGHEIVFHEAQLHEDTCSLARGFDAVCVFVNDDVSSAVLEHFDDWDIRLVLTRSAGFNHIDLEAADAHEITVARVPAYSPWAVAEHAVALVLALNRKIHRAWNRVREGNFSLNGLLGFDLRGRTVGVVGTGKIGMHFAQLMVAFGCDVVAYDPMPDPELTDEIGGRYVSLDELFGLSDIISLHCPLTDETHHLVDADAIASMKEGVMLVNTGRGALIDTPAVIDGLKSQQLGYLAIDVYEEEEQYFFEDRSDRIIQDDVLARLMTFPNVLITAHQGFFTREALTEIAETTLGNATAFESGDGELATVVPQ
jgi:D-lactate dehydrogenase